MLLRRAFLLAAFASLLAACGAAPAPPPAPPIPTAAPVEQEPAVEHEATLDILCDPPTEVKVDGKPAGKTPISNYKVAPGSHDVTFLDELTGPRTMGVKVEAGEARTVKSDRPPSATTTK